MRFTCSLNDPCVLDKQTHIHYQSRTNLHVLACSMTDIWAIFISWMLIKVRSEIKMSSATWYWLLTLLTYIFLLIYFIWLWKNCSKSFMVLFYKLNSFVIFVFPKGQGSPFSNFSSTFSVVPFQIDDTLLVSRRPDAFFPTKDLPDVTSCSTVLTHKWIPKFPWFLQLTQYCNVVSNKSHITSSGISAF